MSPPLQRPDFVRGSNKDKNTTIPMMTGKQNDSVLSPQFLAFVLFSLESHSRWTSLCLLTAFIDLQHELFFLSLNDRLGLAPPNDACSKVKRVLDVGTGTGLWAIDFGDLHPEAEVC